MKEYILSELGFRTVSECRKITDVMEGKTFMKFHVSFSSVCGNCMVIISTNYNAEESYIKQFFISALVSNLLISQA